MVVLCSIVFNAKSVFAEEKRAFNFGGFYYSEDNSQDLNAMRQKAFAALRVGNWQEANQIFEKIITTYPTDALSLYGNGVALFNLRKSDLADINLNKAITILSNNKQNKLLADCLVLSAVISANNRQNLEAVSKLERAIKISPNHFDANLTLGRAYYGNGNIVGAVNSFKNAVKAQPKNIRARFFLATSLEKLDKSKEALNEYREMIKINPNTPEGNLGLGVLLIKLEGENSQEGIEALQKVIAVNENVYEAQITLGKALLKQKKNKEAVNHLKKATELAPKNPEPHYQLALAYRRLGLKEEAKQEMEIVKKIHQQRRGVSKN